MAGLVGGSVLVHLEGVVLLDILDQHVLLGGRLFLVVLLLSGGGLVGRGLLGLRGGVGRGGQSSLILGVSQGCFVLGISLLLGCLLSGILRGASSIGLGSRSGFVCGSLLGSRGLVHGLSSGGLVGRCLLSSSSLVHRLGLSCRGLVVIGLHLLLHNFLVLTSLNLKVFHGSLRLLLDELLILLLVLGHVLLPLSLLDLLTRLPLDLLLLGRLRGLLLSSLSFDFGLPLQLGKVLKTDTFK
mmetsp:Transcript_28385/g.42985  ORF Transcript_28385/g.42985 Transcript_28385/m.42985 type:complete len:241 (+) Transcript_28385:731-1453(+)